MGHKLSIGEKVGYALGDTAANIAGRAMSTFLLIFYTDVFGISAAAAGVLLLVTRLTDGISDIGIGMLADRTNSKNGKFRPWILWTAVPLAISLVLVFSTPDLSQSGKLVYAYVTYLVYIIIYTANNVPYSALMGVMTPDDKERTSLSSYRFAGAYFGGIISQGLLIYLVLFLGGGDENKGYQYAMYLLAFLLAGFLIITYFTTKERVTPPKDQNSSIWNDLRDLLKNKPWVILLILGFLFVTYNAIKQGITIIYFKRYLNQEVLAASYMVTLLIVSMLAAFLTTPLAKRFGKKNLFIYAMIFSAITNGLLYFAGNEDIVMIYILGTLSELSAGILPVLFFSMLGDTADYSEWKNNRRATGLVFSAGTLSMKFGGGAAGAIIGLILSMYGYDGMAETVTQESLTGIKILMSWIPALFAIPVVLVLLFYPLGKQTIEDIVRELNERRAKEGQTMN